MSKKDAHELGLEESTKQIPFPAVAYAPEFPEGAGAKIGLIGCGGIAASHLRAYKTRGWVVVAFFDLSREAAEARRDEYYPEGKICESAEELCALPEVEVVDIALHPQPRAKLVPLALENKKHVLSQKPFVLDLDFGEKLADLAAANGRFLAVNQNGRWAPYVRFAHKAASTGLIGDVQNIVIHINWDHTWCAGTSFERIHHLLLYDFAIHWIDMVRCWMGERPAKEVYASVTPAVDQPMKAPLLCSVVITFEGALATLNFWAASKRHTRETVEVHGTKGTILGEGSVCAANKITFVSDEGEAQGQLDGAWFEEGFQGTMGELLKSIQTGTEPENSARNNLKSLELVFAAVESADTGKPVKPGTARRLGATCEIAPE